MSKYYNDFWEKYKNRNLGDFSFKWPVLKKILPLKDNQKILDFGCGTGQIMKEIRGLSPKNNFIGVDVSETATKIAKKKNPWASFYTVQDGDKFPFKKNVFDIILAADVIEHVYNTNSTLLELNRILKRDGKIIITTPYHGFVKNLIIILTSFEKIFNPTGPHIRFYTKKSLLDTLRQNHFKITEYGYYGRFYPIPRAIYVVATKN